ncbi:hypothetical protein [Micromonospora sp. WMMD737]|uniref:hypothetical protein n=1 Tax=Micromonospora sp. WMMD737 TaxID=3404113 RepID=UPI003B9356E0
MDGPIIGSEQLAKGLLTRGALRWNYTAILPDVYVPKGAELDTWTRAKAAWLWTGRSGVIAGKTAAALHGAGQVDPADPIELIARPRRPQPGVIVRNERIEPDEVDAGRWITTTAPARTALDLARRVPLAEAVALLYQLSRVTQVSAADIAPLEARYRRNRGMGSAYRAIGLMDGGSRSREESLLRVALVERGLPRAQAGIRIGDEWECYEIGIGWPAARLAVEWGPHRRALHDDVGFRNLLHRLGWRLIEAIPQRGTAYIVGECRKVLSARGLHR